MLPEAKHGITSDSLLNSILRSCLISPTELERAVQSIPEPDRSNPRGLATHLVDQGKLSTFQAQKFLKGASGGLILGPYEILAPIGRGGMGTVYLARNRETRLLLALKVLPPRRAREEERLLARFRREMQISQRVSHPHVALTYEAGKYQGIYFIAMEFIPGKTLYRLVSDRGPLSVTQAAYLFSEIASGLDHAHEQGVIHRDLKPSNIMVTPNGHAKLLDLGLALIEGEVSESLEVTGGKGYIVGSMDYIAPEQTRDALRVDSRADIYGLGCTLYFSLTGQPPFPGGSSKEKMLRHRKEKPPSLLKFNPQIPPDFAHIVETMMAKDPNERYYSAKVVQTVLCPWGGRENILPLDRQGDPSYEREIETLTRRQSSTDSIHEALPMAIPVQTNNTWWPSFLARWMESREEGERAYLWLGMGVIGFWVLILLVLAILLIFR